MSKKQDLRVQRTVLAIKEAFFSLLDERPFEKIQVSDIAARAMINRGTFYLHYEDKYNLLERLCEECLAEMEQQAKATSPEDILRCHRERRPLPYVVELLEQVARNPRFFQLITDSEVGRSFYDKFSQQVFVLRAERYPDLIRATTLQKYIDVIGVAVTGSVIRRWVSSGMKEAPYEIASLLSQSMLQLLFEGFPQTEERVACAADGS